MEKNITKIYKNLSLNTSLLDQPEGTYSFGLNVVTTSDEGHKYVKSNEESNEAFSAIPMGYIIIGKVYMPTNKIILFLVSEDNSVSEIGIFNKNDNTYTTEMNDKSTFTKDRLNFKLENQIQAVYRLRKGCEHTVYWVDGYNKPRFFNFNSKVDFQNSNGKYIAEKFNLQKTYQSVPNIESVEVLESGGNLKPGTYNISPQYLDADLNPTEFITSSPLVYIYNDHTSQDYGTIRGSVSGGEEVLNFPNTNKAIRIEFNNLDVNYPFYRLAITEANSGLGIPNRIVYSEVIPTSKPYYIYTGENAVSEGSEEELLQFEDIMTSADHIEQIENTLIIASTKGNQNEICGLQKYASKITVDCVLKDVILNSLVDNANTKSPIHEFNDGLGYMPGEIYSFGIVWLFSDMSLSPIFHIPGKLEVDKDTIFSPGQDVYPMAVNNSSETSVYINNNINSGKDYWGLDSSGASLAGKNIRHHRFPLRSDIGVPLVEESLTEFQEKNLYYLKLSVSGTLKTPILCAEGDENCVPQKTKPFGVRVDYKNAGESFFFIQNIDPASFSDNSGSYVLGSGENSRFHDSDDFSDIVVTYSDLDDVYRPWASSGANHCEPNIYFTDDMCTSVEKQVMVSTLQGKVSKTKIFGAKFSNIEKPVFEGGPEVIGYYIVRNERTEFEKTIVDSVALFPTVQNSEYLSHGLLAPQTDSVNRNTLGVLHMEHKFKGKESTEYDDLIIQGNYTIEDRKLGKINYDDVYEGSSFDSKHHKAGNDDGGDPDGAPDSKGLDGWSFNLITRDNIVKYQNLSSPHIINKKTAIKDHFYLDALGSKSLNDNKNVIYNIAADNKIGVIQLVEGAEINKDLSIPYGVLFRKNVDPYSNFRNLPYYKESMNPVYFGSEDKSSTSIFNGDSYVSPIRYQNTIYWDNRVADRQGKKSILKKIFGAILVVLGGVLTFALGGGALLIGAGITIMGGGTLLAASGIKQANFNKAYGEEYEKGLRKTALDSWTDMFYNYKNTIPFGFEPFGKGEHGQNGPSDDTIQWLSDCVTDLWFESSINMNLRNGFVDDISPTFLHSPWRVESGNTSKIGTWGFFDKKYTDSNAQRYPVSTLEHHVSRKLLTFDENRDDNRLYLGVPLGEYYNINPDYQRRNKQKVFYHLPAEYDCYSDCREVFPLRVKYSLQSFQEELSDNYRVFLPNNYRDLDGETGKITNIFKINNDLFLHTEEALWQVPRNYQERVTDQIVSFVGTGSYFEIPPRKIIDDSTGNSAGCTHKWSHTKSPIGVFFVSENQNKVFHFDGNSLRDLSAIDITSFFKKNLKIERDPEVLKSTGQPFIYNDNPSHPDGTGFITAFDSRKNRLLLTKKDYTIEDGKKIDRSWTLSFSLEESSWISFHSYMPYMYLTVPEELFSVIHNNPNIWEHNRKGYFQKFYGVKSPFIIEYIANQNSFYTKVTDAIMFNTDAYRYHEEEDSFYEERFITFNKAVIFNSRQCSGELTLKTKSQEGEEYLISQVTNPELNTITITRNERDWTLNQMRDIRVDYSKPIFNNNVKDLQKSYFIDKVLNLDTLDINKDWTQLESFRDKYLGVRLIFDNFEDVKLLLNFSVENETLSNR